MQKHKIAVIFGGCSPEHEVSLQSAYSVITHINNSKYEPILLGITRFGEWFHFFGSFEKIKNDTWHNSADCVKAIISPDRETHGVIVFNNDNINLIRIDAAFPVLHGKNGEDGTVQGLLELAGIAIVGCNTLSSALCIDKDKAHIIAKVMGIAVPHSFVFNCNTSFSIIYERADELGYPLFIKPVNAGSSFGITKVFNKDELPTAVKLASRYDNEIIIEENIQGFEVGCAVLGKERLIIGELDEIELSDGFFNFKEKYTLETAAIHVAARLSSETTKKAKETAGIIYKALGCSGFARVDMFITPSDEIFFNEVNTVPGFTVHSRYSNMLKAIGMSFEQVVNAAIESAVSE